MSDKKNVLFFIVPIVVFIAVFIIRFLPEKKREDVNISADKGVITPINQTDIIEDYSEHMAQDSFKLNTDLRVSFSDLYLLTDYISPLCVEKVPYIIQQWVDKALSAGNLNYTVIMDINSIKLTDMFVSFNFQIKEFPQYSFCYSHYYGTDQAIISSPELGHMKFD